MQSSIVLEAARLRGVGRREEKEKKKKERGEKKRFW